MGRRGGQGGEETQNNIVLYLYFFKKNSVHNVHKSYLSYCLDRLFIMEKNGYKVKWLFVSHGIIYIAICRIG